MVLNLNLLMHVCMLGGVNANLSHIRIRFRFIFLVNRKENTFNMNELTE